MAGPGRRVSHARIATALAVACALAGVGDAAAQDTPGIPMVVPDGYAVVPFRNAASVSSIEWMRVALPVALAEKLEDHPGLRAVYSQVILPDGAPPEETPAGIGTAGAALGARWVFAGDFRRTGDWQLDVAIRVYEVQKPKGGGPPTARLVAEHRGQRPFEEVFELIDGGLAALLPKMGVATREDTWTRIRRVPTRDFYAFTLFGRGVMDLHGLGKAPDPEKAQKNLSRTVFVDPKFAEAHRMLAVTYEMMGQFAKADGRLQYAIELRPDYYRPIRGLVRSAYRNKERDEGIRLARRALELRPWDLEVRFLLGDMLWEVGDVEGAYTELSRVVQVQPDHLQARRVLVLVHASRGSGEELAGELEHILRLDPKDESARLDLGAAYHELGREEDAIRTYEGIVRDNPKQMQALKLLGDIYKSRGQLDRAIGYYEQALKANKNDPRPYFLLGAAYLEAGNQNEAIRIYYRAQKFKKYLPDVYNNLGTIFLGQGRHDVAIWYLTRAVHKKPTSPRIRYNLGLALSRADRHEEAATELAEAARLDPRDAEIQFAYGAELLRIGKVEEAEKAFQKVLELDPNNAEALHNLQLINRLRDRAEEGEIRED